MLLAVLYEAMQGRVEKGRVYISPELVAAFRAYWNRLVHTQHDCLMALPFFHMHTEGYWTLVQRPGELRIDSIKQFTKSLVRLDAAVEYAQLPPDLALLIVDKDANALLRTTLLETYFPQAHKGPDPVPYDQQDMFGDIADSILHEDPATYRSRMEQLLAQQDDEEVYLRSTFFKREVPKAYDHRCAISGTRIVATANFQMVDACHIRPFATSHDDTIGNGIALTPTLHRAFDRGLITITPEYRVLVSTSFTEQPGDYGLRRFNGRSILLPKDRSYWPNPDNLEWHGREWG